MVSTTVLVINIKWGTLSTANKRLTSLKVRFHRVARGQLNKINVFSTLDDFLNKFNRFLFNDLKNTDTFTKAIFEK